MPRHKPFLFASSLWLLVFLAMPQAGFAGRAPDLNLKDLAGQREKLSSLRGQIVVLNFWATWCGPCQEELPRYSQLARDYAGKHLRFVAVSIDDAKDVPRIRPLLDRLHVDLDVWTGSSEYALRSFGLGGVVPGTVILDRSGNIVTRIMGEARDQDVRQTVDWLLGGRKGPAPPDRIRRY